MNPKIVCRLSNMLYISLRWKKLQFMLLPPLRPCLPQDHDFISESYKQMQNKKISELLEKNPELTIVGKVKDGRASKIIIDTANEIGADLIVVGHRGASGFINWMLGSVAKQVVESCTVPVLVFKNKALCS
jgi:nucleotide-binding universal stress UspA family protein